MNPSLVILLGLVSYAWGQLNYISREKSSEELISKYGEVLGARRTSCECGWSNKERVVGGKLAEANEFPFQVAIMSRTSQVNPICGSSIITENHILTASHCTYGKSADDLYVIVGGHNIVEGDEIDRSTSIDVKEIIQHEDYDNLSFKSDIAILVLKNSIKFNKFVGRVCMPAINDNILNEYVKIPGWGLLKPLKKDQTVADMQLPKTLMKVNLRVIPIKTCMDYFEFSPLDPEGNKELCTYRAKKDSCRGDSGGPLLWLDPDTNRHTQAGIVSYGISCAKKIPAVSTKVHHYMQWIKDAIAASNLPGTMCYKE